METIPFFECVSDDPSAFTEKIDTLLTWSITPLQFGDHRPYAAATLIRLWRDKCEERAMRREFTSPREFLQDQLFDWLDESEVGGEDSNLRSVAGLFGKFVRDGLFDYAKYVQRLVARGEPGLSYTEVRFLLLDFKVFIFNTMHCDRRALGHAIANFYGVSPCIILRLRSSVRGKSCCMVRVRERPLRISMNERYVKRSELFFLRYSAVRIFLIL